MVTTLAFNELIQGQTIQGVIITAGDRWILVIIIIVIIIIIIIIIIKQLKNRYRKIPKGNQQKLKKIFSKKSVNSNVVCHHIV